MRKSGTYESLGATRFFVPNALPPQNPPFVLDSEILSLYGEAMERLGELNEMTKHLLNASHFIRAYIYKEALLSSEIEGINTTLFEVYTQPISNEKPDKNTQLVMNCIKAIYHALSIIREDNLPIVSRVILGAHKEITAGGFNPLSGGDGDKSNPGSYRKQKVKVGDLIPPPASKIPGLMSDLEKYINTADKSIPPLIRAGLVHVQFEMIHPFLDGNGRIGRLLIVLMLVESGVLSEPILYPSYFFKKSRFDYYKLLDEVRISGNFESWIKYFLSAIKKSCEDACKRAREIEELRVHMTDVILSEENGSARAREVRFEAIPVFFSCPVISITKLSEELQVSYNTADKIISDFVNCKFLIGVNEKKRGRLFRFKRYFEILDKEYV